MVTWQTTATSSCIFARLGVLQSLVLIMKSIVFFPLTSWRYAMTDYRGRSAPTPPYHEPLYVEDGAYNRWLLKTRCARVYENSY